MKNQKGETIRRLIDETEEWFMLSNGITLAKDLPKSKCIRTGKSWNGDLERVTIACIDYPYPHIIWWYKNPKNYVVRR